MNLTQDERKTLTEFLGECAKIIWEDEEHQIGWCEPETEELEDGSTLFIHRRSDH